ncbi:MAG: hypothetical protein DME55_05845 [Verrucomicrobia bacterium]|nr:MAG: hypothetical protein DME55_05845 [Verrucomicrobiota bacterium]
MRKAGFISAQSLSQGGVAAAVGLLFFSGCLRRVIGFGQSFAVNILATYGDPSCRNMFWVTILRAKGSDSR